MSRLLQDNLTDAATTHPDHVAFRCGSDSITYGELDRASTALALTLIRHGVQAGECVALKALPSIQSAVAVYGILKSGAVFTPLDPAAPDQRTAELLSLYRVKCMVLCHTRYSMEDEMTTIGHRLLLVVGASENDSMIDTKCIEWSDAIAYENGQLRRVAEDAPAYVISTSGTTGRPKGIVHTHRSGQSYASQTVNCYGLADSDRIASLSPLHFDMSTFGYLAGVLAKATVVLIPPAYTKLPASLSGLLEKEQITVWYSVPFTLVELLFRGVLEKRDASSLRWVVFAGESMPIKHLHSLREAWPQAWFSNAFGPTETNVCTVFQMPPLSDESRLSGESGYQRELSDMLPIGRPWGSVQIRVVDSVGAKVKKGQVGELLVHSDANMQRYFEGSVDDPNAFWIDDEFAAKKYFRTGDLVRQRSDGNLEFHGRGDRQIKIRGYRVELDAIEFELNSLPHVMESVVLCVPSSKAPQTKELLLSPGTNTEANILFASIRISADGELTEEDVTARLRLRLPEYAIPQGIDIVGSIARMSNGKIDLEALAVGVGGKQ